MTQKIYKFNNQMESMCSKMEWGQEVTLILPALDTVLDPQGTPVRQVR